MSEGGRPLGLIGRVTDSCLDEALRRFQRAHRVSGRSRPQAEIALERARLIGEGNGLLRAAAYLMGRDEPVGAREVQRLLRHRFGVSPVGVHDFGHEATRTEG